MYFNWKGKVWLIKVKNHWQIKAVSKFWLYFHENSELIKAIFIKVVG